jgi:transcriptional regulator with GAF, ATPase, and Fis domain
MSQTLENYSNVLPEKNANERKLMLGLQNESLRFETLLSKISTRFINLAPDDIDMAFNECLKDLVEFLGFDRSSILQFSTDATKLYVTHSYAREGVKPFPNIPVENLFPWYTERFRQGDMLVFSNLPDGLPEEAVAEREYCIKEGFKSHLAIPLKMGKSILGGLGFGSFSSEIKWPDEIIQRLKIVGEIFANALERRRTDLELKKAFSEINQLKDQLHKENIYLRQEINLEHNYDEVIGQSHAIKTVLSQAEQVARTNSTVLIIGETGTGKELLARAIHNQSRRKGRVMVKVNCAALPSTLIESELFGREKGAYTGALTRQIGRFELANGSTIFLDEISELSLELQAKLLRVLQEGQFERLGSPATIKVDARVIAATNRDLEKAVKEGKFREDLYYRLNVFPIHIPPLRERCEDIPALVWTFVKEYGEKMGKPIETIPQTSMQALQTYTWPGNIRELRNVIERAMILSNNSVLRVELPKVKDSRIPPKMTLEEVERKYIIQVLEMTNWRVRGRNGAAEILGLRPTTLESRMMKLGIEKKNKISDI